MDSNSGGYDIEFVNDEHDITCVICLDVLCQPMQAVKCGHRFCKKCMFGLHRVGKRKYKCPIDRSTITLFRDTGKEREILNSVVRCIHNESGCEWTQELRELKNHLNECQFEEIECLNGCGETFQRMNLEKHDTEDCLHRMMPCLFCHDNYPFYQEQDHNENCQSFPLCCEFCQNGNIPRCQMENHINQDCDKAPRKCEFAHLGCDEKIMLQDVQNHNELFQEHHMKLAIQELVRKDERLVTLQKENNRLFKKNNRLRKENKNQKEKIKRMGLSIAELSGNRSNEHKWKIFNFSYEISKAMTHFNHFLSKSFYTDLGYHVQIDLYPNINHSNVVAIYIKTISGEYDDTLRWPIPMTQFYIHLSSCDGCPCIASMRVNSHENMQAHLALQKPPHSSTGAGFLNQLSLADLQRALINDTLILTLKVHSL